MIPQAGAVAAGGRGAGVLWGSLGLNVFLLALCLSRVLHGGLAETASPQAPIARIVAALGPADAGKFRAAMEANRGAITPARAAVSAAQIRLAAAIRRSPFDPQAVGTALTDWQACWQRFVAAFDVAVLAGLTQISDDGRQHFADASVAEDARHVAAQQSYLERGR